MKKGLDCTKLIMHSPCKDKPKMMQSQLEEDALHLVEEGLIQFFSKCSERNIFKQFNEPYPGDKVILGWILEPVVEYLVAALVRIMTGLCPHISSLASGIQRFSQ